MERRNGARTATQVLGFAGLEIGMQTTKLRPRPGCQRRPMEIHMKAMVWFLLAFAAANLMSAQTHDSTTHQDQYVDSNHMGKYSPSEVKTIVAARRNDLNGLAKLYSIDLTKQDWHQEQMAICPAFSKYIFV